MTVHHYFHILIIKSSYWTQTYFLNSTGGVGMMWLFQLGTNRDCDGNKRSLLPVNYCVSHLKHVLDVFAGIASFDHVVKRLFFFMQFQLWLGCFTAVSLPYQCSSVYQFWVRVSRPRSGGSVVRAFAWWAGGCGFENKMDGIRNEWSRVINKNWDNLFRNQP